MALIKRNEQQSAMAPNRRWDPFQMMDELMRWDPFAQAGGSLPARLSSYEFAPAFDVRENKDAFVISADLPGMTEDALELSLTGNQLTIAGRREEEKRDESDRVHMYERRYGSFSRTLALPEGVDTEHIEANLDGGVLTVTVPKKPELKPRSISLKKLFKAENKA